MPISGLGFMHTAFPGQNFPRGYEAELWLAHRWHVVPTEDMLYSSAYIYLTVQSVVVSDFSPMLRSMFD